MLNCINKLCQAGFNVDQLFVILLKDRYQDPDEVPEVEFEKYYKQRENAMDFYLKNQIR